MCSSALLDMKFRTLDSPFYFNSLANFSLYFVAL